MDRKVYKIRRLDDDMFSRGGTHPGFNRTGKTWQSIANLRSHLNQLSRRGLELYEHCIVVEFQIIQEELATRSIGMFVKDMEAKREKKRLEAEQHKQTLIESAERLEWQRLNKKFGKAE